MTAFDTTNLRLAITVPAHGMVRFRLRCAVEGATTPPRVLLGVMNGATIIGRVTPLYTPVTAPLATQDYLLDAEFTVTGLAAGAMNVDAAYGVEVVVAATNIKYGGPNDTTTDNAWGGFVFEAWDPQPLTANSTLAVDANGRVDVGKVLGTAQTAGDLKASLNTLQTDTDDIQTRLPAALVGGRMDSSVGAMAANVLTAAAINADAITAAKVADGTIDAATFAAGAINAAAIADGAIDAATFAAGAIDASAIAADAIGSSELATTAVNEIRDAILDDATRFSGAKIDAAISSRLATASYTAPANATIAAIDAKTTNLPSDPADQSLIIAATDAVMARLGVPAGASVSADVAAVKTDTAAVKAKTDSLTFTVANKLNVNVLAVNGVTVTGVGTQVSPWGPA